MTHVAADRTGRRRRLVFAVTHSSSVRFNSGQYGYLGGKGFDVSVISSPGPELEALRQEDAEVFAVPMERDISVWRDVVSLWRLCRVMRKVRPDLTIVGTPKAGLLGGLAAVMSGVPHRIYTLHGLRLETIHGWRQKILMYTEWLACRCAHKVDCVSPSLRALVIELGLVEPDKAVLIGPGTCGGVDTKRFHASPEAMQSARVLRCNLGIPEDALVIGFVGRFTRDKGTAELYRAFNSLRTRYSDLRLLLLGDFEPGDPVDADVRRSIETDPGVILTGVVPDPAPYYLTMDVFVLPTYREGFPGVILEAQAAGIPVVTTTATGAIDAVLDGQSGLIVPVGDVDALTAAIDRLLIDPALRKLMGADGRAWVETVFHHDIVRKARSQVYEELTFGCVSAAVEACDKGQLRVRHHTVFAGGDPVEEERR